MNYYNEFDPHAAAWLRELINQKLIPNGHVDERSITEVQPGDLAGFIQCHFFAGIGGWSYALQLAGWPEDRPVWTGSCPCQPFSVIGESKGAADERHLWPDLFRLITECKPLTVFGEQVENAIGHGWLDGVSSDLESKDYSCGAVVLGAHSVKAPHKRQRLYWVGDSKSDRERRERESGASREGKSTIGGRSIQCDRLVQPVSAGLEGHAGDGNGSCESRWVTTPAAGSTPTTGYWDKYRVVECRGGSRRRIPTEPSLFPLASRLPYRVARRRSICASILRGPGNAIVPQVAAEFVKAFMSI